mgnify:CR=1 FL=1
MENVKVSLGTLQQKAYCGYQSVYKGWVEYDKLTKTDCLSNESRYTFAYDMVVYLCNPNTAETEIDNYIKRQLNNHCKHNKQAYYELILSTMVMSNLFYEWGWENLSALCADWYDNLFFEEDTIYKYITEEEISDLWGLR